MNAIEALQQTIQLWDALARNPGARKTHIPGPWRKYLSECPCCEYARTEVDRVTRNCDTCPMLKQWTCFDKFRQNMRYIGLSPCCSEYSPYWRWFEETGLFENEKCRFDVEDCHLGSSEYDIEFFCLLIVELAGEALNELLNSTT